MEEIKIRIDIVKTGDNSYSVAVQCDNGTSWTERVLEAELKSAVIRACHSQFQCTA